MKKILILSGPYPPGHRPKYSPVFSKSMPDYSFTDIKFDNLDIKIAPDRFLIYDRASGTDIKDFDLVIVREYTGLYLDVAYTISKYLMLNQVKFFNTDYLNYRPVSKLAQAAIFYELRLPFPEIRFSIDHDSLAGMADTLGYPVIVKEAQASHGDNNFLIKSADELREVISEHPGLKLIAQQYIPNDGDYRLLMIGRKPTLQILRQPPGDSHLNNTSKGGSASLAYDLPDAALEGSRELAEHMGLDLAGMDILLDAGGRPYFLEINFQPQIISGALVDAKTAELKDFFDAQLDNGS